VVRAAIPIGLFLAVLTALAIPLRAYLQRVFGGGRRVALGGPLGAAAERTCLLPADEIAAHRL